MSTYVVAVEEAPAIVCPDWCESSEAHHLSELETNEGLVIHHGSWPTQGATITCSKLALVDGTPVADSVTDSAWHFHVIAESSDGLDFDGIIELHNELRRMALTITGLDAA